jgi:uncharacterized protein YoaH (UPF0181 family)
MKQENLFTVAGTSNHKGEVKARFANDLVSRIKALVRAGEADVNLVELPRPMTKLEALKHLQSLGMATGDAEFVIANKVSEKTKAAKKGEVKVSGKIIAKTDAVTVAPDTVV